MSRIKKGRFKEFLEEYWPLSCFAQSRFCNEYAQLRLVLGNQGYDAIIRDNNIQTKVEISGYVAGEIEKIDGIKLNETGIGLYRECSDENTGEFINRNLLNATKKSKKDYSGGYLLFWINTSPYCEAIGSNTIEYVNLMIKKLQEFRFAADSVFLLALHGWGIEKTIENIDNNIYLISQPKFRDNLL